MAERYTNNKIIIQDSDEYKYLLKERGLEYIKQYSMKGLKYPSQKEVDDFSLKYEIWDKGMALWKLAAIHYNNRGDLWWVIAHFNQKPTDQHFNLGDSVIIPFPLEKVLRNFGL
jgi:hypothetical protein